MNDRVVRVRKLNSAIAALDLTRPIHLAPFWRGAAEWSLRRRPSHPPEVLPTMTTRRQIFGIDALDQLLGGGLMPGTLTVLAGATGAGKTQLGLRWADAGLKADGRRGVVCDLTSR